MATTYVGVDLGCSAMSSKGPTSAVAVLGDDGHLRGKPHLFRKATELVDALADLDQANMIIAVDAPRSVPDYQSEDYAYRSCEREIKNIDKGAGAFSGVAALFIRWYEIEMAHFRDVKIIETYPRVIWKRLGLPGRPKEFPKHREAVCRAVSKTVGVPCEGLTHHEIDAVLCAYTAFCYDRGKVELFGEAGEGLIVIPAPSKKKSVRPGREMIEERFRKFQSMSGSRTEARDR